MSWVSSFSRSSCVGWYLCQLWIGQSPRWAGGACWANPNVARNDSAAPNAPVIANFNIIFLLVRAMLCLGKTALNPLPLGSARIDLDQQRILLGPTLRPAKDLILLVIRLSTVVVAGLPLARRPK